MDKTRYKVLLVEDNEIESRAFERFVENNEIPYDYTVAKCVSDAQRELSYKKFDIVISDHDLGDGTALDVLCSANSTPVIVVTGAGDEETAINTWKAGAYDYIVKDINQTYLKAIPITVENAIKHKMIEDKLQLLCGAVRSTEDSVFITNMQGEIIFVNKAFCKTYGYSEDEIVGKNSSILWIDKNQTENTRSVFQTRTAGTGWEVGFYHKRKDESIFPVSLSRSTIKDINRKDVAIVGVARDISERLLLEDELRSTILKLQKRIQTRNEIAITAMVAIQKFFSEGQIDKASKVISDFLDISKINIGAIELNRTNFNFSSLVSQVREILLPLAKRKNIELGCDSALVSRSVADVLPANQGPAFDSEAQTRRDALGTASDETQEMIFADYDRMAQILINLLLYSIEFSPHCSKIDVILDSSGGEIIVRIQNSTYDLDHLKINKIANNSEWITKQFREGKGDVALGFRIAKELIEMHGGRICTELSTKYVTGESCRQCDTKTPVVKNCILCFTVPKFSVTNEEFVYQQKTMETIASVNSIS